MKNTLTKAQAAQLIHNFRAYLIEKISPAHKKQLLTYLKLTGLKLGFLLNFGEELMKQGITRTINGTLDE